MAIQYNVYWALAPGVTKITGAKIENVTSSYEHSGLTNGITYYYVITSFDTDTSLESSESAEVSATPRHVTLQGTKYFNYNALPDDIVSITLVS